MRPLVFFLLAVGLVAGCGPKSADVPPPLAPVQYDPDGMTDGAFKLYDKNKDGAVDGAEFAACPALKRLKKGKAVSRADLKARFEAFAAAGAESVVPASVVVTRESSPVENLTCTLVPEPYMGPAFKPATCKTDATGFGEFRVEGAAGVGVPAGYYKLLVSFKTGDGVETIPAAFNIASRDVREVYADGRTAAYSIEVELPPQ